MISADPTTFQRRILLCVVGLTPQVVTETLYALCVRRTPPFVPTEVHVVTTSEGAERVRLTLLDPEDGALLALAREYRLPDLAERLPAEHIHVLHGASGERLADITTAEDNALAADHLAELVRNLTADPAASLHLSIAGGRKTMGFLAGYALSLFGRPQDRLSHVLVPQSFESHPSFFYPPKRPRVLYDRSNRPVRTDSATIALAEIPFVRLRHGLPLRLLEGRASYLETVQSLQASIGPQELAIDLESRTARAGGATLPLPPVQLAWLIWFARHRTGPEGERGLGWRDCDASEFLDIYRELWPADPRWARTRAALRQGMTKEYFEEKKARHNKLVKDALGLAAAPYCLEPVGRRPQTRFRLALAPDAIRFLPRQERS